MGDHCLRTDSRPAHNDRESTTLPSLTKTPRYQPGSDSVLRLQHVENTQFNIAVFPLTFCCCNLWWGEHVTFSTVFEQVIGNQAINIVREWSILD